MKSTATERFVSEFARQDDSAGLGSIASSNEVPNGGGFFLETLYNEKKGPR